MRIQGARAAPAKTEALIEPGIQLPHVRPEPRAQASGSVERLKRDAALSLALTRCRQGYFSKIDSAGTTSTDPTSSL